MDSSRVYLLLYQVKVKKITKSTLTKTIKMPIKG